MKRLIMLCGVLFLAGLAFADTTEVVCGSQVNGNTIPFWGSGYGAHRFQNLLQQSEINLAGQIIKLAVMPQSISNPTYNNLRLYLCHTSRTSRLSPTFDENYDGNTPQLMFDSASYTFNVSAGQWLEFPANFDDDNLNSLLWEIRWRGSSGQNTFIWRCGTPGVDSFRVFNLGSDSAVTGSRDNIRYYVKLTIVTATGVKEVVVGERAAAWALTVRPNPVRHGRGVRIDLAGMTEHPVLELQVYDMNGRLVNSLPVDQNRTAVWDMKNAMGMPVPAGVYVIRCSAATGRVVVVE